MNTLISCLFTVVVIASSHASAGFSAGYYYPAPSVRISEPSAPATLSSFGSSQISANQQQYYSQDAYGQYSYGYSEPLSSKQEVRTLDGVTRGSYSYIDAAGKLQTVDYTADGNGFRVAATNLPRPISDELPKAVVETPEVMAARAQHLAAHKAATESHMTDGGLVASSIRTSAVDDAKVELPQAVMDTAEVIAAKRDFFNRYEEEKLRHKLLNEKKSANAIVYQPQTLRHTIKVVAPSSGSNGIIIGSPLAHYGAALIPSRGLDYTYQLPLVPQRAYLPVA